MPKITIELIQEREVFAAFHPETKKEAKALYYKHASLPGQYTRLTVGARQLTTAQAERYLGPQKAKGMALVGSRVLKKKGEIQNERSGS